MSSTAILTTADGEAAYEPTAPYVLSKPDEDWCYAIVRTADGEVLGTDGWQQMGVVEDASFQRDLAWILPELNRLAGEIERLTVERGLWRKLAEARSGILVAYRVGGRPPGKHIDAARDAERRLAELRENGSSTEGAG